MPGNVMTLGDQVIFNPNFGAAIVVVLPGVFLKASGLAKVGAKPVAVVGDESAVRVMGCVYSVGDKAGGVGMITMMPLKPGQFTARCRSGVPMVLAGSGYQALFTVQVPALSSTVPPVPDPIPMYMGTCTCVASALVGKFS